jgi:hypothetical protein
VNAPKSYSPLRPTRDVSPRRLVVWCTAAATNLRARSSHYQGLNRPSAFRTLTPACECRSAAKLRRSSGFQPRRLLLRQKQAPAKVTNRSRSAGRLLARAGARRHFRGKGEDSGARKARGWACFAGMAASICRHQPGTTDSAADIRPLIRAIACPEIRTHWSLHGYMSRYFRINLDPLARRRFLLLHPACRNVDLSGYEPASTTTSSYQLFERTGAADNP